jgi:hypothetical protein
MRASSFLRGVAHVERQASAVAERRAYPEDDPEPYRRANRAREAVSYVATQFVASVPLPTSSRRSGADADGAVETLLDRVYERSRPDPSGSAFDRARAVGRADAVDGILVVPLGSDPPGISNWYTVSRSMVRYAGRAAVVCDRIEQRLRTATRPGAAVRWRELSELLVAVGRTVATVAAAREWIDPPETDADGAGELIAVAKRTVEHVSPDSTI